MFSHKDEPCNAPVWKNMGSCTSNHIGILGQVHFRTLLEATTPAKLIRTKHGIKIGKAQKRNTIYARNLKYISQKTMQEKVVKISATSSV